VVFSESELNISLVSSSTHFISFASALFAVAFTGGRLKCFVDFFDEAFLFKCVVAISLSLYLYSTYKTIANDKRMIKENVTSDNNPLHMMALFFK
jgi:hypothetical protein